MIMKTNTKLTIATAALSGLLAGGAGRASASTTGAPASSGTRLVAAGHRVINLDDTDKHACKGQNSCKGKGGCKTGDQGCKGKNSCKGNGGCKTNADDSSTPPAKML
jgi:hypothetical protein